MHFFKKNNNLAIEILVEHLSDQADSANYDAIAWQELEVKLGSDFYQELLNLLTQTEFEPKEARRHWYAILEHRKTLEQALGRMVSFSLAVGDYFTWVEPRFQHLVLIELHRLLQKERHALVDELTGLYNRRYFNHILQKEVDQAHRFSEPFTLLMLDVDNFKDYNDILGHTAGDRALSELAQVLMANARTTDHLIRYGGEEFILLMPRSGKGQALSAADRFHQSVADHHFYGQEKLPSGNLTVTIGLAAYPEDARDGLELVQKADQALYKGKQGGRNQVVPYQREKRRHDRYPLFMDMLYRQQKTVNQPFFSGATQDISLGGLACQINQAMQVGSPLEIILGERLENELKLGAQSVWLKPSAEIDQGYLMGLSFIFASPTEEEAVRSFITSTNPTWQ